ncbi:MAG TPA: translation initiation factor IF-3 [Deltaproteobacteria bacterium]|nr:translation initiation factor IF-3 [Deltaproteobacteria bacterium]
MVKNLRANREIRSANVRLIGLEGEQLGIISLQEALEHAEKAGMDLVEVSPNADPPVCKVMDYGKYRYKQSKKLHDAKKSQTVIHVKEIRLRPKTEEHDIQVKIRHIKKFLDNHDKVKISMLFRGREIAFTAIGRKLMENIKEQISENCIIDQEPRMEGRNLVMIVSPRK